MKKRLVALVLCIVLVLSVVPTAGAASYNGTCGENLNWSFNEATGKLTIIGSGRMNDYGYFGGVWTDFIDKIMSVSLPEGLTTVGSYAFYGAVNLKEITFPNSLCIIGTSAFADCPLERITFGTGLQMIEGYAFENLKVKNLVLPEGLIAVENLKGDGVETLTIPASLIEIGTYEEPMLDFSALKSVSVSASNPVFSSADGVLYSKDKTRVVLYPSARGTTLQLPDSVTDISCIEGCEGVTELTLPARFTDYSTLRISEMFPNVEIVHVPDTVCCLEGAFYDCTKLKTVNIPAGISSLNDTFVNCSSLERVDIPESVVMMDRAFLNCVSLESIELPDGVRNLDKCFYGCTSLTSVTVPSSVETMESAFYESGLSSVTLCNGIKAVSDNAFSQSKLTEVTIPDSVTTLGVGAFYMTPLENITFGKGVEVIEESCFSGCSGLRELHFPDALTYIGDAAFNNCPWLNDVTLGDNVEFIGHNAFVSICFGEWEEDERVQYVGPYLIHAAFGESSPDKELGEGRHYNRLTVREGTKLIASGAINNYYEVILPESMTVISEYTFCDCNVVKIRLPGTLREIRHDAFSKSALEEINLPESLQSIDDRAFYECEFLENITLPKNLTYLGNAVFAKTGFYYDKSNWENGFLYLNQALLQADESVVTDETVTVKAGTKLICGYALSDLPMLTVNLPESITMLGWGAFSGCKNLSEIKLPESITMMEGEVFYECENLRSLTLPSKLTSLGDRCFQGSGIRSLDIPKGIAELPAELFKFSQIRSVTIPDTVRALGEDVFWGCGNLTEVKLPQGIPEIPRYTFYGVGISELSIPQSVTSIGESAFKSSHIEEIKIPSALRFIGEEAFNNCMDLTSVSLPDGLEIISENAFIDCENLKSLTIPASVQYIGLHAFGYDSEEDATPRDDVCIYGTPGTEAEHYALANHIPFNAKPTAKQSVYSATAVSTKYATVSVSKTSVKVGEPISVSVTPKTGYEVIYVVLTNCVGGSEVEYAKAENENTFYMPESNVFASAVLLPLKADHTHEYTFTMHADDTYHWRQCACGDIADKASHKFVWKIDMIPTEKYEGRKHEECAVCGYCRNLNTVIPPEAEQPHVHDWYYVSNLWQHWQTCDCGEMTEPAAHTYVWLIDYPATKEESGWKHRECSVCGYSPDRGEEIPPITDAHTHEYVSGWTYDDENHWHECGCGAKTAVAAHSLQWVLDYPATTEETGMKHRECSVCGGCVDWTEIPKLPNDHTHSYTEVVTPPTCTQRGYTTHTCTCGDSYIDSYVNALGHVDANPKDEKCDRCGAAMGTPIDPDKPCDGGASCPGKSFTDMPKPNNWAHAGIDFCVENGLFAGTSATTFSPDGNMTRAMLVTVLYRLEGQPAVTASNPFSDVANDQWFTNAIIWAADKGVVSGVGGGKFNPDGNITREQIATIMYRYAEYKSYDVSATADLKPFPDETDVSAWAYKALAWANAEGLVSGVGANGTSYLQPLGNATRAQVAAILMRYVKNIAEAK